MMEITEAMLIAGARTLCLRTTATNQCAMHVDYTETNTLHFTELSANEVCAVGVKEAFDLLEQALAAGGYR